MAITPKSKAVPVKSPRKSLAKTPAKPVAQKQAKKGAASPAKPAKKPTPAPVHAAPKPGLKKPTPVQKTKAAKAILSRLVAPKKDLIKKTVKTPVPAPAPKAAHKHPSKTPTSSEAKVAATTEPKKPRFNKADLDQFKAELLNMRDRITGQSGSMRNDALKRTDEINPEEDGTDSFMRLQTLEQVSSQHQIIANINESLRAIEKGTYGVCETCGELINKPRLMVLPFAHNCIKCQSEMERPRRSVGRK